MGYKKLDIAPGLKLTQAQTEHLYLWGEYGYTPAKITIFYEKRKRPMHYLVRESLKKLIKVEDTDSRIVQDKKVRDFYKIYKHSVLVHVPEELKLEVANRRYEGIEI